MVCRVVVYGEAGAEERFEVVPPRAGPMEGPCVGSFVGGARISGGGG